MGADPAPPVHRSRKDGPHRHIHERRHPPSPQRLAPRSSRPHNDSRAERPHRRNQFIVAARGKDLSGERQQRGGQQRRPLHIGAYAPLYFELYPDTTPPR